MFRVLLAVLGTFVALLLLALALSQDAPKLALLVPFLVLVIAASHREAFFSDETAINGSIVVICAAFVAFRSSSPILGPTICGVTAGIHCAHLRRRVWSKVLVNSAATGLAAAAGAALFSVILEGRPSNITVALAIPPAVLAYWTIDNLLIGLVLACVTGGKFREHVGDLIRAESVIVLFGIAGGIGALVFREGGMALGVATIAGVLVVVDVKVLARLSLPAFQRRVRRSHAVTMICAAQIAVAAAIGFFGARQSELTGWVAAVAGTMVVTFLIALMRVHRRIGVWDRHLALGVALADAPLVLVFAVGGALAVAVGVWVAIAAVSLALGIGLVVARRRRRLLAEAARDDRRLAAAVELAVLDGRDRSSLSR